MHTGGRSKLCAGDEQWRFKAHDAEQKEAVEHWDDHDARSNKNGRSVRIGAYQLTYPLLTLLSDLERLLELTV